MISVFKYRASISRPFGLITFSALPKLRIPYTANDSCSFLEEVSVMTKNASGVNPITSYEKALMLVEQQVSEFRFQKPNIVCKYSKLA